MDYKRTLQDTIISINTMADLFYQQKDNEGIEYLNETITKIGLVVEKIFVLKQENKSIIIHDEDINYYLNKGMEALANNDYVLLSDIFLYDLSERLQYIVESFN